jgi:phospholipase C
MSSCTKWVDTVVITCQNWASQISFGCSQWADEGYNQCTQTEDEGYNQCSQTEDEGYNQCSQQQQQSQSTCSSWGIFSFICTAWNTVVSWVCVAWTWVSNLVCVAWTWISNVVCVAWHWVANLVCQVFSWLVKFVCLVFSWIAKPICVAWDTARCAALSLAKTIGAIFGKKNPAVPKIEHVFVLMLENRAFDHMLGFSGISGMDINGNPTSIIGVNPAVDSNLDSSGNIVPASTPADFQLKNIDVDPGHEFLDVVVSLCGKNAVWDPTTGIYPPIDNSGFIQNYQNNGASNPARIMKCFDPKQIPVVMALANEFAVCDNWFSSLPGPTWPNRFFFMAATSGGLDGSPSTLDIIQATTVEGYRFENGNIFDLLDSNCIDWCIYEGDDFPVSFALNGMNLNALQGRFKNFGDFANDVKKSGFSQQFVFIEPKYGAHAFDIGGPGDFTCGNSMHPLDDITRGEKLIKEVYESIRNSPLWNNSILLITFDEHGGFYDHVKPPPGVPPGDLINQSYVQNHFKFDQLGVRVPAIVVSPFTQKNVIDHTQYDHASMLATVEQLFGMENMTNRDKAAQNFIHLFSLSTPRTDAPTSLPNPAVNPNPLVCEEDDEDRLIAKRSELRIAREDGVFKSIPTNEIKLESSQAGFLQIALLKVLQGAEYPDRAKWIEDYKKIKTGVDAAIFMTEAKLKLKYGVDFKKIERDGTRYKKRASR